MENLHWEPLAPACRVLVSREHTFNTDTILLAHFAAPKHKERCIDLGTGCGTISLLWQRSVSENGYEENIEVIRGDIREIKKIIPHPTLDLAACNPPYKAVGAGLRNPDERMENARHECTCTLEDVAKAGRDVLRFGGRFCLCQRPERLADAMNVFRSYGLEPKRLRLVQQRINTAPSLFLLEVRRGGKPGLSVLPTLIIEDENGGFSAEMLEIYGNYKFGHEGGRADGRK